MKQFILQKQKSPADIWSYRNHFIVDFFFRFTLNQGGIFELLGFNWAVIEPNSQESILNKKHILFQINYF